MRKGHNTPTAAGKRGSRAARELRDVSGRKQQRPMMADLYHRAKARLRARRLSHPSQDPDPQSDAGPQRLLHELEVHQIELEMQNAELQKARNELEMALEKYVDLYDFAPVGYFSVDDQGRILEVNLRGAALLGVERSRLINQPLPRFLVPARRPVFLAFLARVFARAGEHVCEAPLLKQGSAPLWASFHGASAISSNGPSKWCRLAVSDLTSLKQAEEAKRRAETLAVANRELKREIVRRQAVEEALRKSEQHSSQLLDQARNMHRQLQLLSRELLSAQEEERKKISRELHDVIAQTLTGINLRLATLKKGAAFNTKGLEQGIASTQRLVRHSVDIVHRFARELRPAVLDDLGLIPALHTFLKRFREETGIYVSLHASAAVEQMDGNKRTVLYRVAQEALTNVARHAHASRVEVRIQKLDGEMVLKIKDDGNGFPKESLARGKKNHRLGLLGMRERVEMVHGRFAVESVPGKGTLVRVEIPLANPSARGARKSAYLFPGSISKAIGENPVAGVP